MTQPGQSVTTAQARSLAQQRTVIGLEVLRLRLAAGYARRTLADRVGVKVETLDRWESGQQHPSRENLEALSRLFAVYPSTLLGAKR